MKKIFCGIPVLVMTFVILLGHPLKSEASEMNFPGVPFNSNMEFKEVVTDPDYELSDFVSREQTWHVNFVDSLADVHVVMLESERTDDYGNTTKYHTYMFYSTDKFHLQDGWSSINYNITDGSYKETPANMYDRTSSKNSGSGMYYYQVTSQCSVTHDEDIISKSGIPRYRIPSPPLDDSTRAEILTAIANGTFDEKYEFVEGSNVPEYDPDNADYVGDIGYLQNVNFKYYGITSNGTNSKSDINDIVYRWNWDRLTNTKFDVSLDNVYVSFYNQVSGYAKMQTGILGRDKVVPIEGKRRFIKRVKGSDLTLACNESLVNKVCAEDVNLFRPYLDYVPVWIYERNDISWLRIEVYDNSGQWKYGGWYRMKKEGNGFESSTVLPNGDVDIDGGYEDGVNTPIDVGIGSNEGDAAENSKPVDGGSSGFSVDDFPDILKTLMKNVGEVPAFLGELFSFLPQSLLNSICTALLVVIIMRILGR